MDQTSGRYAVIDKGTSARVTRQSLMPCYTDKRQTSSCNKAASKPSHKHVKDKTSPSTAKSSIESGSHDGSCKNALSSQKVLTEYFRTKNSPKIRPDKRGPSSTQSEIEKKTEMVNNIKEDCNSQSTAMKKTEIHRKETNPKRRQCKENKVLSNIPDNMIKKKRGRPFKKVQNGQLETSSVPSCSDNQTSKIVAKDEVGVEFHTEVKKKRGRPSKKELSSASTIETDISNTVEINAASSKSKGDTISNKIATDKVSSDQLDKAVSKKRGRPSKNQQSPISTNTTETSTAPSTSEGDSISNEIAIDEVPSVPKKRGRPMEKDVSPSLQIYESADANFKTDATASNNHSTCSIPIYTTSQDFSTKECQVVPSFDHDTTCVAQASQCLGCGSDNSLAVTPTSENGDALSGESIDQTSSQSEYSACNQAESSSLFDSESEEAVVPSVTGKVVII